MRVPDFSSLAKCPNNVDINIMNSDTSSQANFINNYASYADEGPLTSSIKFIQQALSTSPSCYPEDECSIELNNDDTSNYDLIPTGNTYKSFKEFFNNTNNDNCNNNNNNNNKNNNTKSLYADYYQENLEEDNDYFSSQIFQTEQKEVNYSNNSEDNNLLEADKPRYNLDVVNQNSEALEENLHFNNIKSNVIGENDDVFSSTSTLSNISRTSKGFYIPRGIINPNYPGFQHLAHTLSEHHFPLSVPSTDDSDFSENEMELSTDSFDDISGDLNDNNNFSMNLNSLKENTEIVTNNFQEKEHMHINNIENSKVNNMGRNLERALTLQEYSLVNGDYFKVKHFLSLEHLDNLPVDSIMTTDYEQFGNSCITPDILESTSLKKSLSTSLGNDPDLLNEVKTTNNLHDLEHDNCKMVITPMVDIIGDFGKEVEREFGLLVNGYINPVNSHEDVINSPKDKIDGNMQEAVIKSRAKDKNSDNNNNSSSNSNCINSTSIKEEFSFKSKYQKHSFDERQLPPIGVDYSRCQTVQKTKSKTHNSKNLHGLTAGNVRQRDLKNNNQQHTITTTNVKQNDVDEFKRYKQIISDKELILSKSRYANNNSSWAQYLKDSNNTKRKDSLTPNALELFDAYKITNELDQDTLKKHLKLAKEIEKKRRSNRDEIRRRLAGLGENEHNDAISTYTERDGAFSLDDYASSDTESYSSDSETCPKLSRKRQPKINSGSTTPSMMSACAGPLGVKISMQETFDELRFKNEEEEDFFTKQTILQIETRIALAQSKEIAHWQSAIEKHKRSTSPITEIVHFTMQEVGYPMPTHRRRITRQILTNMSIAHLKVIVNNFHKNIENFNVQLMSLLMKRDDLHLQQDELLKDIEEMTKYLGVNFTKQLTYPH